MTNEKPNANQGPPKQSASEIFLEEVGKPPPKGRSRWRGIGQAIAIPALAIFTGLLIGGILIVLTSEAFYVAWGISPIAGLKAAWNILITTYYALFTGAFGSPREIFSAI